MNTIATPLRRPAEPKRAEQPWWRVPMVWVVIGGPLSVVVASIATAVIAWKHIDPVIAVTPTGTLRAGDDVSVPARPHDALAPALKARNHVATPQQP